MEIIIMALLIAVLAETSYLTYKNFNRTQIPRSSILMDTSALIDGRIVAIARSGLISALIIVPKSVVAELQFMADRADHDKRERARFGLDVIDSLQQIESLEVRVVDDHNDDRTEVDEQLMKLALAHKARLCTIDYNLNKAARVQQIEVININELAHALRVVHLPGEQTTVKIVQSGQERGQGVGYLDDGTMVVVDEAKALIGQEVEITVTRVLQTAAGKMMFGKLVSDKKQVQKASQKPSGKNAKRYSSRTYAEAESRSSMFAGDEKSASQTTSGASMVANDSNKNRSDFAKPNTTSRPDMSEKSKDVKQDPSKKRPQKQSRPRSPQARAESNLVKLANQEKDPRD